MPPDQKSEFFWTILAYVANGCRIPFKFEPSDCPSVPCCLLLVTIGIRPWNLRNRPGGMINAGVPARSIGPCVEASRPSHLTHRRTLTFLRRRTHGKKDGGRLPGLSSSIRLEPAGDSPGWIFGPGGDGAFDTPRPPPLECGDVLNSAAESEGGPAHLSHRRSVPTRHVRPEARCPVRSPWSIRNDRDQARWRAIRRPLARDGGASRSVRLDTDVGLS